MTIIAYRYKLLHRVGNGNMSEVYQGEDLRQGGRTVAVKLLNTQHKDAIKQEMYRRETAALEQMEHPNIVRQLDYGWSEEQHCHYIIFEYLPHTLVEEIEKHKQGLNRNWGWPILREITDALMHAHAQGVIHRDLKSSNILLSETGQPKLTDFGISLLRFELRSSGITLAAYYSEGYASPEQRKMEKASPQSDIYSLGCVFYHVLSGQEPPVEGLTQHHIHALHLPPLIEQMFQRMLDVDARNRFASVEQLARFLETTKKLQTYPNMYFRVTENARKKLVNAGLFSGSTLEIASEYLNEQFVRDSFPQEAQIELIGNGSMLVFTDTLKLICARDPELPLLTIADVDANLYIPEYERQRSYVPFFRYNWRFLPVSRAFPLQEKEQAQQMREDLFQQLTKNKQQRQAERKQRYERKDFTQLWNQILDVQQDLLNNAPKLSYRSWSQSGNTITFALTEPVPDDLNWPESSAIALLSNEKRPKKIGLLMNASGQEVQVTREALDGTDEYPVAGIIGLFQIEAQSALDRQRRALEMLISGGTLNPRLPDVLQDLSTALFDEPDESLVFRDVLGKDQEKAVRQALAAKDIFVLQGPPGTGKTKTLAEIIYQILQINPRARILVSSQSNVAVNHVLTRVAELFGGSGVGIVRLGRPDKIKEDAQKWTKEYQLGEWRKDVISRTNTVISVLQDRVQQQQRFSSSSKLSPAQIADLEQYQGWLQELTGDLDDLVAYENRVERLQERLEVVSTLPEGTVQNLQREVHEYREKRLKQREYINSLLELIREALPAAWDEPHSSALVDEHRRLSNLIANLLSPSETDSREEKLIHLVRNWQNTFGKQKDFEPFLFERAQILAATCSITGSRELRDEEFDWAIIDEAGRATATELLVPLVRSHRAILVGDEKQLPPMLETNVKDEILKRYNISTKELEKSLFETLVEQGKEEELPAVQMLTQQYRMHPAIGQLVSTVFYDKKLEHGTDPRQRVHQLPWLKSAVVWSTTTSLPERAERPRGSSYFNPTEVDVIVQFVKRMEQSYRELGIRKHLAIITPYQPQILLLRDRLRPSSSSWLALTIEIATIDSFQGRDSQLVIYSTVRSNDTRILGFLKDRRRLNVALSRAQELLILVGDSAMLANGRAREGNPYEELFRYMLANPDDCLIKQVMEEDLHDRS